MAKAAIWKGVHVRSRLIYLALAASSLCGALLALMVPIGRWSGTADALTSFLPFALVTGLPGIAVAALLRRRWLMVVNALTVGVAAMVIVPEMLADRREEEAIASSPARVTIVTHNLLKDNADPAGTIAALAASDADILLLQEARGAVGRAVPQLHRLYPYHSRCVGNCDLSILSRLPLDRPRWRLRRPDGSPHGPPLLWARVKPPGGKPFTVVSIHLPWPLPADVQAKVRRSLVEAMSETGTRRMVLAGDFNLTPWGSAMRQLDGGLSPMRRVTRGLASWPAQWRGWSVPYPLLAIDQVFVGPAWRVERVERLKATGSDHYPLKFTIVARD